MNQRQVLLSNCDQKTKIWAWNIVIKPQGVIMPSSSKFAWETSNATSRTQSDFRGLKTNLDRSNVHTTFSCRNEILKSKLVSDLNYSNEEEPKHHLLQRIGTQIAHVPGTRARDSRQIHQEKEERKKRQSMSMEPLLFRTPSSFMPPLCGLGFHLISMKRPISLLSRLLGPISANRPRFNSSVCICMYVCMCVRERCAYPFLGCSMHLHVYNQICCMYVCLRACIHAFKRHKLHSSSPFF
jgi:hypothetical protein